MQNAIICSLATFLILLEVNTVEADNAGVYFHSLENKRANGSCPTNNCEYVMEICLSFHSHNCSLEKFTSKTWRIVDGGRHKFSFTEALEGTSQKWNPLMPTLTLWFNQPVYLNVTVKENTTASSNFSDALSFRSRLPYPTTNIKPSEILTAGTNLTRCGNDFCLSLTFYTWCISLSCVALTTASQPTITSIQSSVKTVTTILTTSVATQPTSAREKLPSVGSTTKNILPTTGSSPQSTTSPDLRTTTTPPPDLRTTKITPPPDCDTGSCTEEQREDSVFKKWWFILIVVLVGLLIIVGIGVVIRKCKARQVNSINISVLQNDNSVNKSSIPGEMRLEPVN